MKIHENYLSRCLQIAKNGLGTTLPNPMVGAVVVEDGRIIGEGFTSAYGGPHAEVRAIESVRDKKLLQQATLYVSLEPCCHYGKTPPCTELILKYNIPRVVVGIRDPHAEVSGKGIEQLKAAGCEIIEGVLAEACREHHRRFLTFHQQKRPYLILKWAESADGFLAPEAGRRSRSPGPVWITTPRSRQLVHKWRSEEQGILVGTQTALQDNPALTVRNWSGSSPTRMVLDRQLRIPRDYSLFDGAATTWVLHEKGAVTEPIPGVRLQPVNFEGNIPQQIAELAHTEGLVSLLVEGGGKTLQSFIAAGLWDEARVLTGSGPFGRGIRAPRISGRIQAITRIDTDRLTIWRND